MSYGTIVAVAVAWNLFDIARIFNSIGYFDDNENQNDK